MIRERRWGSNNSKYLFKSFTADIFIHVFIKHILWIVVSGIHLPATTRDSALWRLFGSLFMFQLLWGFYSWVICWFMVGSNHNHFAPIETSFETLNDWSSSAYLNIISLFPNTTASGSTRNNVGVTKKSMIYFLPWTYSYMIRK